MVKKILEDDRKTEDLRYEIGVSAIRLLVKREEELKEYQHESTTTLIWGTSMDNLRTLKWRLKMRRPDLCFVEFNRLSGTIEQSQKVVERVGRTLVILSELYHPVCDTDIRVDDGGNEPRFIVMPSGSGKTYYSTLYNVFYDIDDVYDNEGYRKKAKLYLEQQRWDDLSKLQNQMIERQKICGMRLALVQSACWLRERRN